MPKKHGPVVLQHSWKAMECLRGDENFKYNISIKHNKSNEFV